MAHERIFCYVFQGPIVSALPLSHVRNWVIAQADLTKNMCTWELGGNKSPNLGGHGATAT